MMHLAASLSLGFQAPAAAPAPSAVRASSAAMQEESASLAALKQTAKELLREAAGAVEEVVSPAPFPPSLQDYEILLKFWLFPSRTHWRSIVWSPRACSHSRRRWYVVDY